MSVMLGCTASYAGILLRLKLGDGNRQFFQVTLIFCTFLISFHLLIIIISNTQNLLFLSAPFSTCYFYFVY